MSSHNIAISLLALIAIAGLGRMVISTRKGSKIDILIGAVIAVIAILGIAIVDMNSPVQIP